MVDSAPLPTADAPAPPERPTVTMAVLFATPAIVWLAAALLSFTSGLELPALAWAGAWILCVFSSLDGLGYAVHCLLPWRYKLPLFGVHIVAVGSVLVLPALFIGDLTRSRGPSPVQIQTVATPLRKELVAFHDAQRRFPSDQEWEAVHPRKESFSEDIGPADFRYHRISDHAYQIFCFHGREMTCFSFNPDEGDAGKLGWETAGDDGDAVPLRSSASIPEETALFQRLKAARY